MDHSPPSDSHSSGLHFTAKSEPISTDITQVDNRTLICARFPRSNDGYGTTECLFYNDIARHLGVAFGPGFPFTPEVPDHFNPPYEIRSEGSVEGLGMFAKRNIKVGEVILVERPLMVAPIASVDFSGIECPKEIRDVTDQDPELAPKFHLEPLLRLAFDRMGPENREAYAKMSLDNVAESHGVALELSSIWAKNSFTFHELHAEPEVPSANLDRYTMVFKEISRVNHSCLPNGIRKFDLPSFSLRVFASRNIKEKEEIFYSYFDNIIDYPTAADRQEYLEPYGFTCSCASCSPPASAPSKPGPLSKCGPDAIRISIHERYYKLVGARQGHLNDIDRARNIYKDCIRLLTDDKSGMIAHGFQGTQEFVTIYDIYFDAVQTLCQDEDEDANIAKMKDYLKDVLPYVEYLPEVMEIGT
ncbi:hypothetical protein BDQ17DRAFT_1544628 [Cyathus striatus]|nr:hypothetical protein BDQ17DRAFT_1544628 [Cyathus striatus]